VNSEALQTLAAEAAACTACRLAETRNSVVFGVGGSNAALMFIGEAPGRNEDPGRLLDRLAGEVGIERDDVYIANVLKCRPPGNRDPREDEISACKGYLAQQIKLIDPAVVMTLGNFASKLLLRTTTGITRLRGTAYPWWGRFVVPTFHPAAALRGGERVLNDMREDFALTRRVLDEPPVPEPQEEGPEHQEAKAEPTSLQETTQLEFFA
jgi:DNA polymerase